LYQIFFKTYTEKVWGIPCSEIRAEWAAQRIQGLSLGRAILSAMPLHKRRDAIRTLIRNFQYPRLGPGQMWERCRDRIEELHGRVLLGHRATAVEHRDGSVTGVRTEGPDGPRFFAAEHVISTMPIRSLVRAFRPELPAVARTAADSLRYRDLVVVALMFRQERLFPDNWIYIHTPGVRVGRIQNFGNWSPAMVPEPGTSCLGLEYFCFAGDDLWSMPDRDLIGLATEELRVLRLADPEQMFDGTVVRMPGAYPIYDATYQDHLRTVRRHLDPIDNLHLVGRNGMHKYNNQDHSMLTAMMTVWNMHGATHDVWSVNTDFEYHEEQRLDPATEARSALATRPGGVRG
jgi:protoporphyrinogen oxidase